ncbi:hypothetical protein FRC12_022718 [Ceratobasidium sp. 428]|nr:hypothetical protein FRC12_022718 [Ceratobasidium sp. 428]
MSKRNVPNSPNSNPRAPKVPKALWSANVPPGPAREPALKDKANRKPTQSGMSQAAPKANSREAPVIEILDSSDKVPPVGDDSGALPGPTRAPPLKDKTNQGKSTGKSTRSGKATSEAKGKKKKVVGSDSSDEEPAAGDDYEDDGDDEVEKGKLADYSQRNILTSATRRGQAKREKGKAYGRVQASSIP